jgi:hypothetical protein
MFVDLGCLPLGNIILPLPAGGNYLLLCSKYAVVSVGQLAVSFGFLATLSQQPSSTQMLRCPYMTTTPATTNLVGGTSLAGAPQPRSKDRAAARACCWFQQVVFVRFLPFVSTQSCLNSPAAKSNSHYLTSLSDYCQGPLLLSQDV